MSENFKKEDGLYTSKITDINLEKFISCRTMLCSRQHRPGCRECPSLISAAADILASGVCEVSKLYRKHFSSTYRSSNAVRRFMQLPVVVFRLSKKPGMHTLVVVEQQHGIDYKVLVNLVHKFTLETKLETDGVGRDTLRDLCKLASTEGDRKLLKFAVCEASKYSSKKAQEELGVQSVNNLKREVRNAMQQAEEIRREVSDLAAVREKSALRCLGLYTLCDSESSDSDNEGEADLSDQSDIKWLSDSGSETEAQTEAEWQDLGSRRGPETMPRESHLNPDEDLNKEPHVFAPNHDHLLLMLRENNLNWFSFVEEVRLSMHDYSDEVVNQVLIDFSQNMPSMGMDDDEEERAEVSRQAYLTSERVATRNNMELTDSESDDPEDWVNLDLRSEEGKDMLVKQRAIIRRMAKRQQAKIIAEQCLLKRKVPKKVGVILTKFPNIGKDIEEFVTNKRCGADSWRRTGVTTFDGNRKRGPKASFRSIQEHIQTKYNTKIGYGTIVQMCVVRNKRKLSAKRYRGVAKVTCRRARKGFNLKFNADAHYSSAMYKILDKLQLSNGRDKVIFNRDDQAGFRLDTTYTHSQHKVLSSEDQEVTTRTDFVNKYSSVLQTSSYLFMETGTNEERAAGIVKNHFSFQKNPSQHAADFKFLKTTQNSQIVYPGKALTAFGLTVPLMSVPLLLKFSLCGLRFT